MDPERKVITKIEKEIAANRRKSKKKDTIKVGFIAKGFVQIESLVN